MGRIIRDLIPEFSKKNNKYKNIGFWPLGHIKKIINKIKKWQQNKKQKTR